MVIQWRVLKVAKVYEICGWVDENVGSFQFNKLLVVFIIPFTLKILTIVPQNISLFSFNIN